MKDWIYGSYQIREVVYCERDEKYKVMQLLMSPFTSKNFLDHSYGIS